MGRKFTKEEFIERLYQKNEHVRNGEIEIIGEYNGFENELAYFCRICKNIQNPVAASLLAGYGCKTCGKIRSSKTQRKSNQEFQEELKQLRNNGKDVYSDDKYINNHTKIWFYCSREHKWLAAPKDILRGRGCPYCSSKKVLIGYNDIATTSPDIFRYLANQEDGYKYTRCSNIRIDFKCVLCGHIQNRKISSVAHKGFKCECCGDGISYPNKFGVAFFDQLPIEQYKAEYSPEWGKPYIYDIYFRINEKEYLVEWDGSQHSDDRKSFYKPLEEYQEIDNIKSELAKKNNVHLIRIDCAKSSCDYIKNNIQESELSSLFDLSKIDWDLCDQRAQNNLVKMVCDLWMSGIQSFEKLSNILHLGNSTVRDYINKGTRLGWCDYDSKQWITKRCCPIRVISTINGQEYFFKSLVDCSNSSINFSDHKIAEETIKKYVKTGDVYNGLTFESVNQTIQN